MNFSPLYDQLYAASTVLTESDESLSFSFGEFNDKHDSPHAWSIDQNALLHGGIMPPIPEDFHPQHYDETGCSSYPICDPSPDIGLGLEFDLSHAAGLSSSSSYSDLSSCADYPSVASTRAISPLCLSPVELLSLSSSKEVAQSFEHLSLSESGSGLSNVHGSTASHSSSPAIRASSSFGSDFDAEGEAGSSDSDFLLSPPTRKQRRRYSPYALERPKLVSSRIKPRSFTAASHSSPVHVVSRPRSRNVQVDVLPEQFEKALRSGSCTCPACGFIPASRRLPDLRRHMNTHCADVNHQKWVCCGVPLKKAGAYNVQDMTDTYIYKGHAMVGGCLQSFSRRDALVRHLSNGKMGCRGSADIAEELS